MSTSNISRISQRRKVCSPQSPKSDLAFLERHQDKEAHHHPAKNVPASAASTEPDSAEIKRHTVEETATNNVEFGPETMDRIKVVVLGAPAVGKTSIVQQFVWNNFYEEYVSTESKHTYYPSVITTERLYEIKITDLPVIPFFPVNSYYEWANYRYYGLRSATAYILVFDLSNIETFQYVRTLREQIQESRNTQNVPILVVGNKQDLILTEESVDKGQNKPSTSEEKRRDIVNLVKKHWKTSYIECSAKYNWKVVQVFKELINMVDNLSNRDQTPMLDNLQDALDRNKCVLL